MTEPLVLLPGMMCDARLFGPQLATFSGTRATMVGALSGADTISALAQRVLDAAPARFALAGLSMGGIVAMEIMAQAPERVTRLALLNTNHLDEPANRRANRDRQMAQVHSGGLRAVMRDEMKPNYLADGPTTGAVLDLCMAMAEDLGPEVFITQSRALQTRPDQTETLKRIAVPTLVLCGEADSLCPPTRHREIADLIPGATLRVIPGAGHLPVLEQPDLTNAALCHWLDVST